MIEETDLDKKRDSGGLEVEITPEITSLVKEWMRGYPIITFSDVSLDSPGREREETRMASVSE